MYYYSLHPQKQENGVDVGGGGAGFDRHENLNGGNRHSGEANKFFLQVIFVTFKPLIAQIMHFNIT